MPERAISKYVRDVPRHYQKTPEIVDVILDEKGCAEIMVRSKRIIVRVNEFPVAGYGIVESICMNLLELFA